MSETRTNRDSTATPEHQPAGPLLYPEGRVVGVVDTADQLAGTVEALTRGGFLDSELLVVTGHAAADAGAAITGRTGLTNLAIRVAERLGLADEEMEVKAQYEQAMRDGHFVVSAWTPNEARKQRAAELLRAHGGHDIMFMGRFAMEGMTRAEAP